MLGLVYKSKLTALQVLGQIMNRVQTVLGQKLVGSSDSDRRRRSVGYPSGQELLDLTETVLRALETFK
jgi:hypothetical protein